MTALQWPGGELPQLLGNLKCLSTCTNLFHGCNFSS